MRPPPPSPCMKPCIIPGQPLLQGEPGVLGLGAGFPEPAQPVRDAMDVRIDGDAAGGVPGHVHHQQGHLWAHTRQGHLVAREIRKKVGVAWGQHQPWCITDITKVY